MIVPDRRAQSSFHRMAFSVIAAFSFLIFVLLLDHQGDALTDTTIEDGRLIIRRGGAFDPRAIPEPTRSERFQRFFGIVHERHVGSFRLAKTGDQITVSEHAIVVELFWYRVALLVAPVLWLVAAIGWWRREARRTDRLVSGRCASCGYDLRATPERCPECGTVSAKTPV